MSLCVCRCVIVLFVCVCACVACVWTSGHGVLDFKCGDRYEGEFAYNMRNGFGKVEYRSGNTEHVSYEGHWKDDSWHGKGKSVDKDGNVYEVLISLPDPCVSGFA